MSSVHIEGKELCSSHTSANLLALTATIPVPLASIKRNRIFHRKKEYSLKPTLYLTVILVALLALVGCAQTDPPDATPDVYSGPYLSFETQDDTLVFGPFSGGSRSVDYFWWPGGEKVLLVVPTEENQELWLIDASTGDSRLLRQAAVEALFPIAWQGSNTLLSLDISTANSVFNITKTTWNDATASTTTLLPGTGRVLSHAVSEDARWVTLYSSTEEGGQVVRLDTSDGTITPLRQNLPSWDGLFPVWLSPSGLHGVLPAGTSWPLDLELLDMTSGDAHTFALGLNDCDRVFWNTDGDFFAYKYADGSHSICPLGDMNTVLSPKVRVHDTGGDLVWEIQLPHQGSIGDLYWLDSTRLLLVESDREEYSEKDFWIADLASQEVRPATEGEADSRFSAVLPYPMSKGESNFRVEIEYQTLEEGPAEVVRITP